MLRSRIFSFGAGFLASMLFVLLNAFSEGSEVLYEQALEPYPLPILLPVTIGSNHYTFFLDTGCTSNTFDPALNNLLGTSTREKHVWTASRDISINLSDAPAIAVGGWKIPPAKVLTVDLGRFRQYDGRNLRGVIGDYPLLDSTLALDFDHQRLRIMKGNHVPAEAMESLSLEDNSFGVPMVQLKLENHPVDFVLDTGFNLSVGLNHDTFTALTASGMIKLDRGQTMVGENAGGSLAGHSGRFTRGQLLGVMLAGIPVIDTNKVSNLGMAFLLNFNVVIDYGHSRFYFQKRKVTPPIAPEVMLGAVMKFPGQGKNFVYQISERNGAAWKAGLREGDRIIKFGPLKEPEIDHRSIYELCLQHPNESLEVVVIRPTENRPILTELMLPKYRYVYPPADLSADKAPLPTPLPSPLDLPPPSKGNASGKARHPAS